MASPAIWDMIQQHPDAEITLLGLPLTVSVFQHSPYNIKIMVYDRSGIHKGIWGMMSIAARLRKEKYDLGYLLTHSVSSALIFKYGKVKNRIAYGKGLNRLFVNQFKSNPKEVSHQADRYYHLLHSISTKPIQPKIYLSKEEQTRSQTFLEKESIPIDKPIIGMAVGASYGTAKRWFPERYAEVGKWCVQEFGAHILLFGSNAELETIENVHTEIGGKSTILAGRTYLRDSFALAERCSIMLCNDSGMMHAASAVNTPVIAMIGPTNPRDTSPLGKDHILINKQIECAPCLKRECPLGHHQCMKSIEVAEVKSHITTLLNNLFAS